MAKKKPNEESQSAKERRLAWRFPVRCRVDYTVDGRAGVGFCSNLSNGGLFLQSVSGLSIGQRAALVLHLDGDDKPLNIEGVVVAINPGPRNAGAHVSFGSERPERLLPLQRFLARQYLPKFERAVAELWPKAQAFITLAAAVKEQATAAPIVPPMEGTDLGPHQHRARMVLEQAHQALGQAWPIIHELEGVVSAGLMVGKSESLADVQHAISTWRQTLNANQDDLEARLRQRFEQEKEVLEVEQQRTQKERDGLKTKLATYKTQADERIKEMLSQVELLNGELKTAKDAVRKQKLEYDDELKKKRALLHKAEQETANEKKALGEEQKRLAELEQGLQRRLKKIEYERATIQENHDTLAEQAAIAHTRQVALEKQQQLWVVKTRELEGELAAIKKREADVAQKAKGLQRQAAELEQRTTAQAATASERRRELDGLRAQIKTLEASHLADKAEAKKARAALAKLEKTVERERKKLADESAQLVEQKAATQVAGEEERSRLQAEVALHKAECERLTATKNTVEGELAALSAQFTAAEQATASFKAEILQRGDQAAVTGVAELEAKVRLARHRARLAAERGTLDQFRAQLDSERAALAQQEATVGEAQETAKLAIPRPS